MFADLLQRIMLGMLGALLPLYMVDMGYSKFVAGLTTTVYMLVAVAFRPIVGRLVDTKGRYLPLIIGTVVFLVASGFFSARIPLPLFLVMRGLQGLGFSFIGTALMTMATDAIPKHRMSEGIGYFGLSQTISRAFFPMVALTLKDAFGYQVTYLVIFGTAFVNVLAALTLRSAGKRQVSAAIPSTVWDNGAVDSRPQLPGGVKERVWEKLVDRDALKPAAIMLVFMFASSCFMTFVIVYAVAKQIDNPGVFFIASAIAVAAARLFVGRISQRFGSVAVLGPGMALASISMVVMFWMNDVTVLVICGALSGFAMGMLQPELHSLAVVLARDERRGLANSTFFMAMDLGGALGAIALGVMADHTGLGSIFLAGGAVALAALFGYLFLHTRGLFRGPSLRASNEQSVATQDH